METALGRVRARGVEPKPALLALYERYVRGEITGEQLQTLVRERRVELTDNIQQEAIAWQAYRKALLPDSEQ
jgi:hypothetical protein